MPVAHLRFLLGQAASISASGDVLMIAPHAIYAEQRLTVALTDHYDASTPAHPAVYHERAGDYPARGKTHSMNPATLLRSGVPSSLRCDTTDPLRCRPAVP